MTYLFLVGLLAGCLADPAVPTAEPRREFRYQHHRTEKAIYNHDGRLVLVAGGRQRIGVFHGRTALLFHEFKNHREAVTELASWPERDTVISGGANGELLFWQSRTGKQIGQARLPGRIQALAPQPGSPTVAVVANGIAYLFDLSTKKYMPLISWAPGRKPTALVFSGAGEQLAIGYADGGVLVHDFRTGQRLTANPFRTPVRGLAFHRDSLLAVAGTARLFACPALSPGSGQVVPVSKAVWSVVQTDKTGVLLGTQTGSVLGFGLADQQERVLSASTSAVRNLVVHPRESLVLASYVQGTAKSWLLRREPDGQ